MSTHAKAAPGSGRGPARSELVTPTLLRAWPLPGGGSGKDDRGSVLVIGGARMTPGAALLAGVAALRSGAGRLTLAVAESVAVHLAVALPEAGVILDAFALGSLPELAGELGPWAGRLILTPNVTEAGILLGHDAGDLARDVPELAEKYGAVVSCQGVIARPAGADGGADSGGGTGASLWEITTGHSGLGTSGSGDVLSGTIAGLRARGTTDAQAACWGTHLHAAAGDRLASRLGGLGYLARELTEELPPLMMELGS